MLDNDELVVVAGAGGFIGGHLVADLLRRGCRRVRAVDVKPLDEWFQLFPEVDNRSLDLRERAACDEAADGAAWSTTSPPTWAAWASSRPTRPPACSRC